MKSFRFRATLCALAVLGATLTTACHNTYVVVPHPENGYSSADTLRGYLDDDEIRVTFRFDTIMRVDTVVRTDTLWRAGTRTLVQVDTVIRPDTILRIDTVQVPVTETAFQVDTILKLDTVRVPVTDTVVVERTVRVPGQRLLFLPPGHYPPEGQCRVWIHGVSPGQQAKARPCEALGEVPDGAFILFGGDAWDFDYDWLAAARADPGSVPPEIIALKRPGGDRGNR